MTRVESILRRLFRVKEMGWKEYDEVFDRYTLLATPWGSLILHKLIAPLPQPCHDHPWSFWTFILAGGYIEHTQIGTYRRKPGDLLYRPAEFAHSVQTYPGKTSWSILLLGPKRRQWKSDDCNLFGIRSHLTVG
jgi:hypothetical protein